MPGRGENPPKAKAGLLAFLLVTVAALTLSLGSGYASTGLAYLNFLDTGMEDAEIAAELGDSDAVSIETSWYGEMVSPEMLQGYIRYRNPAVSEDLAATIVEAAQQAAKEFHMHPLDLIALMAVESDYRVGVVSHANAIGLMQVHVPTWLGKPSHKKSLQSQGIAKSRKDLFVPEINIRAGTYVLRTYVDTALEKGLPNPMRYALTRYFGGSKNPHYDKFRMAVGDYYVYTHRHRKEVFTAHLSQ